MTGHNQRESVCLGRDQCMYARRGFADLNCLLPCTEVTTTANRHGMTLPSTYLNNLLHEQHNKGNANKL